MKTTYHFFPSVFIFALILVVAASACAPASTLPGEPSAIPTTENSDADLLITLERTPCHGTCPVYKLTISGNGEVIYEGHNFVAVEGEQTESLSPTQIQDLVTAFEQANFFSLRDYIDNNAGDSQSVITSITMDGKTKTVNHYYGDNRAPQELFDLESRIDEITNSKQWTSSATPPSEDQGVIVTFRVAGVEQYKIRLTDPVDIEIARQLLAGEEAPHIPNGVVVRDSSDVNVGYSWHIDPESLEFADFTTEVCDGLPSDVEKGLITSDRYCPWSAEVITIDE